MGLLSSLLGFLGFGFGIGTGILVGFFLFIYSESGEAKDPTVKSLHELDSEALQDLLLEIPIWVKSPDYDRIDWFNKFILEMWPYLDKAVCGMIRSMVKPMFDEYRGMFYLKSIDFQTLTLGSIPPTVHGIKVIEVHDRQLVLEPALRWVGDLNATVVLKFLSIQLTIQLVDLQISMAPRVTLKPLVPAFPCFGSVSLSLMEKPHVDFGLKFLGGDIMAIPGLYRYVQKFIKYQVARLYLWPKTLDVPILDPSSGAMRKPVGILHVKVVRATNLSKMDLFGKSDPYVKLSLSGERLPAKKTTVKMKTLNPEWNEKFKLIVKEPETQLLQLHVYDWEKVGTHDKLGMQVIPLRLLVPHETKVFTLCLMKNTNKDDPQNRANRGQIIVEVTFDPFREDIERFSSLLVRENTRGGSERAIDESVAPQEGLLMVTVLGAEHVEGRRHTNPYSAIAFRGETKKTKVVKKTRDPNWNEEFQFMVEKPSQDERIHIEVLSKWKNLLSCSKESLGHVDISLADVLNNGRINEKYHLINSKNGVLHVEIRWKTACSFE